MECGSIVEAGKMKQNTCEGNKSKRHTAQTVMNRAKPGRATSEENAIIYARKGWERVLFLNGASIAVAHSAF